MTAPKISVCIPVYNGAEFIAEAIDSVLNQTYKDFELIVVDNHSTDNTMAIVQAYKDPRIQLFQNPSNIGLIPNWNMAMSKASGEYIKILPADDLIYPRCLELQVAVLEKDVNKRISMVCGIKNVINDKGRVIISRGFAKTQTEVSGTDAVNRNMRSGGNTIGEGGAILFRREILQKTGVFNATIFYTLDLDMWYKILLHGNLYFIPEIVSAFRVSGVSESTRVKNSQRADIEKFMKQIYAQKQYKVKRSNYLKGLLATRLSTFAKKMLYRFLVK